MARLNIIVPPTIRVDPAGDGHFGASRGSRTHSGIDYVCTPGKPVFSPVAGTVTKHGYPYGDDLQWRYIEITDEDDNRHRLFYVEPTAALGEYVLPMEVVGESQDISQRYPGQGMLAHVHYEIKTKEGDFIHPEGEA